MSLLCYVLPKLIPEMSCIKYANCRNVGVVLLNFYVSFYTVFCHIVMSSLLARLDLAAVLGSDECERFSVCIW
jgi:hypothetical protein